MAQWNGCQQVAKSRGGSRKGRSYRKLPCPKCYQNFGSNVLARHIKLCGKEVVNENESRWHTELWTTTWVAWGYGPPGPDVEEYFEPSCVFDAPPSFDETEYRREVRVGWCVRNNNLTNNCGWNLSESEAAARKAAIEWVKAQKSELHSALEDIRIREE